MSTLIQGVYKQSGQADQVIDLQVDSAGRLVISGTISGGSGGGSSDTTEATQLLVKTATQNTDTAVQTNTTAVNTVNTSVNTVNTSVGTLQTNLGAQSDAAASSDTGTASIVSLIKRGLTKWTSLFTLLPASLGAKLSSASFPVVLASDQSAVNVSATNRSCVGRQTLTLVAGTVYTLTVPGGALAANIQADGTTFRITQEGTTPTATIGTRVDDSIIYPVDTSLANVKIYAVSSGYAQVCYFDKA